MLRPNEYPVLWMKGKETTMSVLIVSEWAREASMSEETYWKITDQLGLRDKLPEGCEYHMSGYSPDGGTILSEVWTSPEAFQTFAEAKLGPASQAAGLAPPRRQ